MLFKVGNKIIDTEKVPVALIFKTKDEAKTLGTIISNIKGGDTEYPVEIEDNTNGNWWFMNPAGWDKSKVDEWSVLNKDQAELLDKTPELTRNVKFEL